MVARIFSRHALDTQYSAEWILDVCCADYHVQQHTDPQVRWFGDFFARDANSHMYDEWHVDRLKGGTFGWGGAPQLARCRLCEQQHQPTLPACPAFRTDVFDGPRGLAP